MRRIRAYVIVCLVLTGCGTSTSETTTDDITVKTRATSTTIAPVMTTVPAPSSTTSTVLATTTTTTPSALEHGPALLVAHTDGIDLWTPEQVTPVLRGREVGVAYPDLAGGLIFSVWDEEGRNVIEWMSTLDDAPELLIADPEAHWVHPTQVTWVEGRRTLVYRKIIELPNDCPADHQPDCGWEYLQEYLHVYDLDSGTDRTLGGIGGFESDDIDVRFGGGWAAVTYTPYGAPWACSTLVPARQLLDTWLDPWPFPTETDAYGNEYTVCYQDRPDHSWATITADGSSWMQVIGTWEFPEPWRLVGYDPEHGDRVFDVVLPEGVGASWYEYDGTHAVLGMWTRTAGPQEDEPVVLVEPDGTVTELDLKGPATIWSE